MGEAKWSDLTKKEAERARAETLGKSAKRLPPSYTIEEVYVVVRSCDADKPWLLTSEKIERGSAAKGSQQH